MADNKPAILPAMITMKCPNCRKGHMFVNKSIFPLSGMLQMPEKCESCGQKFELEVGFYYGTGYVSYALSVALYIFNFVWYGVLIGLSYKDNSIFYCLGISTAIVLILQPWLMRFSRVLYLYMFVKYGKGAALKTEE
ncbi:hypothetical protein CAP35_08740 [Chitinophagaceae bacterium IBVUCB1]|jgi:uncharacterized protein (DUF983 family)|nr:hypothetical protein CAP35_08740 [Chitinophagaceae bacterium IBVUCB1]